MKSVGVMLKSTMDRLPGRFYLILAVIILASSNSIVKELMTIGSVHAKDYNPITFCNVLFVGNLCALITLLIVYYRQWDLTLFKSLSRADWVKLVAVSTLSVGIAPAFIFSALAYTSVTNVILIGRIESPLLLLLSVLLLHEQTTKWQVAGLTIAFLGVVTTVVIQQFSMQVVGSDAISDMGTGEILAAIGAIALTFSTIISKKLTNVPLGFFAIFRMFVGTLLFFSLALCTYGPHHFEEAFSPFLWKWMILYGGVVVVLGQLCWFRGLRMTKASQVSLITSFTPVAGITVAFLILAEVPTLAQWIGGGIILAGVFIGQCGGQPSSKDDIDEDKKIQQGIDSGVGFKGV